MAVRHAEMGVELPADRAGRAVPHDGQSRADVHAGCETLVGPPFPVHALIEQTDAKNLVLLDQRLGYRRAGPELNGSRALNLGADPLHKLAQRKHQAAAFVQEAGRPRKFQRVILEWEQSFERANARIRDAQRCRTPACADGIEQINHLLGRHRRGHGNAGIVNPRKSVAQGSRAGHHTRHAETDVLRAFVAEHLRRHAGENGAFDYRRAVAIDKLPGQRREKTRRRRAEADADDVRVHALAVNGRGF